MYKGMLVCGLAFLVLVCTLGCVRRVIRIRTEPEGAMVEMDGTLLQTERTVIDREGKVLELTEPQPLTTPIDLPFDWYGTHEFVARHEGYKRARKVVKVRPPWYEFFPLDFMFDNLWPWTLHDIHTVQIELEKERPLGEAGEAEKTAAKEGVRKRGDEFRKLAREKVPPPKPKPKPAAPPAE